MNKFKTYIKEKLIHQKIDEKLIITKDSKLAYNKFKFTPKSYASYYDLINGLTITLPFNIIVNDNKQIEISHIVYDDKTYDFDAWDLYDQNNKQTVGLTCAGVYKLFIANEEIYNHIYNTKNRARIKIDLDNCKIELPTNEKLIINSHQQVDEKLVINKNSKLANHEFVFKPTETSKESNMLNNLKVILPFNIIVNDHIVTSITKINLTTEYGNDYWEFYDNDNKLVLELLDTGVVKLLITFEELNVTYYEKDLERIVVDKDTLKVIKESINEKLIINKDSKLKSYKIEFDKNSNNGENWAFTDDEIDKILDNIKNKFYYNITPSYITNLKYDPANKKIEQTYRAIFLFYSDEWRNIPVNKINYIMIYKATDGSYSIDVHKSDKHGFLYESDWFGDLDEAFNGFYTKCKNINLRT